MDQLTAVQCRAARMLLKWNVRELGHKTGVASNRITQFENRKEHLYAKEHRALIEVFLREYIVFGESDGVKRMPPKDKEQVKKKQPHPEQITGGDGTVKRL
jgi:transcriptional regulator with XRE-family HTH domain